MGFMPQHFEDQVPSLFHVVPGVVVDYSKGNYRNLDRLTVLVTPQQFEKARKIALAWRRDNFQVGQCDCTAFVAYLARHLHLKVSDPSYVFPQDFVARLKSLNSKK
jgi:hypothetical protein